MGFIRYPGGKSKLKKHILPFPSLHDVEYREPFLGGGSIFLDLLLSRKILKYWINERDFALANLWTSIFTDTENLIARVHEFTPTVTAFKEFVSSFNTSLPLSTLESGFRKLAIHQMSYSGLGMRAGGPIGGESQTSDYDVGCRYNPDSLEKKFRAIVTHSSLFELREKQCTSYDFQVLIEDDSCPAFLYLDPPYFEKGADLYTHFFSIEDHQRLAAALQKTKHQWVLSYDDHPEVRELYHWANIKEFEAKYSITSSVSQENKEVRYGSRKKELLISPW